MIPTYQQEDGEDDLKHPVFEADWDTVHEFRQTKPGRSSVLATYEHKQSASSAYWDPSGRNIVSTSYDNFLRSECFVSWVRIHEETHSPIQCISMESRFMGSLFHAA